MQQTINIAPLSATLGAEITGVDLSRPVSEDDFIQIREALWAHQVIFFRDYEALSEPMKAFLQSLHAYHSASSEYGPKGSSAQSRSSMQVENISNKNEGAVHPVVRTHPEQAGKQNYLQI